MYNVNLHDKKAVAKYNSNACLHLKETYLTRFDQVQIFIYVTFPCYEFTCTHVTVICLAAKMTYDGFTAFLKHGNATNYVTNKRNIQFCS